MTFSPIRTTNLRAQVVAQIRQAIINGQLKPGDHIVEKMITDLVGVSRTPVREALILLESEGLIESVTNKGSFVRTFTVNDVNAIFTMRTALENFAADLSIAQMTEQDHQYFADLIQKQLDAIDADDFRSVRSIDMSFHRAFIDRAKHPLLKKSWEAIVAQIAALLYVRAEAIPDYDEYLAVRDHQAILDAYRSYDIERVRIENDRINTRVAQECVESVRAKIHNE